MLQQAKRSRKVTKWATKMMMNEEDDEDEDNKIYFGKFREWLQRETLKTIRMRGNGSF